MARIGWYVLFLIAFFVYLFIVSFGQKVRHKMLTSKRRSVFVVNQLVIVASLIPIIVIPWILTSFFSRTFLLVVAIAFEISALLTYLSNHISWISAGDMETISTLWGTDLALKRQYLLLVSLMIFGFVVLAYFPAATYIYFANPLYSEKAVRQILTLSLGLYVVGGLVAAASNMSLISSPQISDRARRAFFLAQIASALQLGIVLTVYLGLVGIGGERFLPHSIALRAEYSQYVPLVVMTSFYLLILTVPYLIGLEARRRAEILLYSALLQRIERIIRAVGIPSGQDLNQLRELRDEYKRQTDAWIESEPMTKLAMTIESGAMPTDQLDPVSQSLVGLPSVVRDEDLRFINLKAVENMLQDIDEMIDQYNQFASQPIPPQVCIEVGRAYDDHFRDQRQCYENRLKKVRERKAFAPVLAGLLPVLGAVPVVLQYGQKLIGILPFRR